jgi:hypothetical protein
MPIMLPGTMSDAGRPPLDDDEAERDRKAKAVMLMGQHGNLMGQAAKGLASADPNSPDYLSRVGHGIRQMHLMRSITPAIDSAISPDATMPSPAAKEDALRKPGAAELSSTEPAALSPALMGAGMPPVMRPSRHASIEAGKREYQEGLPQVTAPAGSPEAYSEEMARMNYQREHPWGAPISAHPGFWGKVGHVAARMGNIAGDVFAPVQMAMIPGTDLNKQLRERGAERGMFEAERGESELMGTPESQAFRYGLGQGETPTQAYRELHPLRAEKPERPSAMFDTQTGKIAEVTPSEFAANPGRYQPSAAAPKPAKEDRHISSYTSAGGRHVDVFQKPDGTTYEREGGAAHVGREGGEGTKPDTLFSKRAAAAEKKDSVQEQIAALNAQIGTNAWTPEAKARLAALQDKFKQAAQEYDHWDGLYRQRTGGGAAPAGMVAVQIPGAPIGHIPRNQLARFKKDHPNAKVIE